jgi:hypothetical protein
VVVECLNVLFLFLLDDRVSEGFEGLLDVLEGVLDLPPRVSDFGEQQ